MKENIIRKIKYVFKFVHLLSKGFSSIRNKNQLNQSQERTLLLIHNNPGKTLKDLNSDAVIDQGTFSRVIQSLVTHGYIIRKTNEKDRRKVKIFTTQKGKLEALRVIGKVDNYLKYLFENLNDEERIKLDEALTTIENLVSKIEKMEIQ